MTLKIYRTSNKGYDEFKLVYYGSDGNRKFKTFAEYQDAKNEAEKVNASFSTGNADTLVQHVGGTDVYGQDRERSAKT